MAKTTTPEVDKKELEAANAMWLSFTNLVKVSTIATAAILLLMLIFLYN